jgi:hypothetical protein
MVIFMASNWLLKILLTSQRALSARAQLAGLFLSMFCAAPLKLEISATINSLPSRTLINALSISQPTTRLAVA